MKNLWDDDDQVSEYDLIADDAAEAEQLAAQYDESSPALVEADDEALEEISDEAVFELSHQESNTIYNARLRLEQAKLYEMLINHNLFEGVDDVSADAIKNVQNELKFYIVKRLEILLGLREPTARVESSGVSVELPFNEVEIDFLKQLAYKGTFGKSAEEKAAAVAPVRQTIKPLTSTSAPKQLKSLGKPRVEKKEKPPEPPPKAAPVQQAPAKRVVPPPPQKAAQPQQRPVQKAPAKTKASPGSKVGKTGVAPRNMTQAEIMEIAKADLATSNKKPFHEMNAKEKAQRIKEANDRNARPFSKVAAPMPNADQIEMKYRMQQDSKSYSRNQTDQLNTILANALAAQKHRGEDND